MRKLIAITTTLILAGSWAALAQQRPGGDRPAGKAAGSDLVDRMMAFDKDKDGKLTKDEVTDERLTRLFDRADANKDGSVTREELTTLASREDTPTKGGFGFGPGGPGGPGGMGRGGPGGPGGFPRPGEVLGSMFQDRLALTADQKTQLADLQKDVDARLAKILTAEQNAQLKEIREQGPGGPGGPGRGGPGGGPGGPGRGGPGGQGGPGGPGGPGRGGPGGPGGAGGPGGPPPRE